MKKSKKALSDFDKLKELCPEMKKEDVLILFPYNLHPQEAEKRCDGRVIVSRQSIIVFRDGKETD